LSIIDSRKFQFVLLLIIISILTLSLLFSIKFVFKILYPFHYRDLIEKYSAEYNLDPFLVAAIIRVESKFNEKAVSPKGAKGLMQISSTTGKWASKELGIKEYHEELLFNPNINIKIGCWYLNVLNKEFDNNLSLVLAAYNGGSGNVNKWLKDIRYSDDGYILKDIPFAETKAYLEKVYRNLKTYKILYERD